MLGKGSQFTNIEKFLESTMPSVPAQFLSKTTMKELRDCDVESQPYFVLGDLWDSYKQFSAYGAGVPLVLNGSDEVIQYYVPSLSGIQLYGESKSDIAKSRRDNKGFDSDHHRNLSSDGRKDEEVDQGLSLSREVNSGIGPLSLRDSLNGAQEGSSSGECEGGNSRARLLFEFFDYGSPYNREPLLEKISDLSCQYPQLKTLRSCNLLPNSWVSVAWYPLYRLPIGPAIRDLSASFLTYHSLSTLMRGGKSGQEKVLVNPREIDGVRIMSLAVFGMAAYKFEGPVWIQNGVHELQRVCNLTRAAENWLKMHDVNHPDFQFFASHATYSR